MGNSVQIPPKTSKFAEFLKKIIGIAEEGETVRADRAAKHAAAIALQALLFAYRLQRERLDVVAVTPGDTRAETGAQVTVLAI